MTSEETLAELTDIFRQTFDDPSLAITRETDASQIEDWDSFMHINLIVSIEERFHLTFSTSEIGQFTCVGDVLDCISAKTPDA